MIKMKVTFINPPQTKSKYKFLGVIAPPMGIAYMAAVLEENNIDVDVLDAGALDLEMDEVKEEIKKRKPDIVSITALTPTFYKACETAEAVKEALPDCTLVMGGYHPTFEYESALDNDAVDIVIIGEGELTILQLTQALEKGEPLSSVKGLAFKDESGKIVLTPPQDVIEDLDSLPWPAHHLLPMEKYKIMEIANNMITMITSRGCPMQCSFCSSAALHGEKLRTRSTKDIVDEMEHYYRDMGISTIAFMDDTFTINKKKVREICNEILARDMNIMWGCTSRVDTLDEDLLNLMKDAGCITIFMGVESADQQMLDKMNKNITIEKTERAFSLSNKIGIRTIASVAIGMPNDTKESIEATLKFVKKLKPNYAVYSLATPYPGTRFYKEAYEKNLIKVKDFSKYTLATPIFDSINISRKKVNRIQKMAFVKFYLRPSYIVRQVRMDGMVLLETILGVIKEAFKRQN